MAGFSLSKCWRGCLGAVAASALSLSVAQAASPVTVAFIGDQGHGRNARAVLKLIKDAGAHMVLHQGDLDYKNDPDAWDDMITHVLGADYPYFASIGNHDDDHWYGMWGYQAKLRARLKRIQGARCSGDLGVKSVCTYRGLFFILSGIGTMPKRAPDHPGHIAYLDEQLAKTDARWRICSWHKNQRDMQVGGKQNAVGWRAYDTCREHGAIIATGHEHSYSRTHLMDSFESLRVASRSGTLEIARGRTFAFVNGLAGRSIRKQRRRGHWWAAVDTADQGASYGALFCTFNAGGDPTRADCWFRDIKGRMRDRFRLINRIETERDLTWQGDGDGTRALPTRPN